MIFLNLDIRTALFFLFIGNMTSALFFAAYSMGTEEKPDLFDKLFFAGKLSQGIAWLLILFCVKKPACLCLAIGNFLLVTGQAEECFALISLTNISRKKWGLIFGLFTLMASILCLNLVTPSYLRETLVSISTFPTFLLLITGWAFFMRPVNVSWLTRLMGILCTVSAIGLLSRSLTIVNFASSYMFYFSELSQVVAITLLSMIMFMGNFGYILIKKAALDRKILYMATHDPLTGALNKSAFREEFTRFHSLAKREKTPFSLLMADLDHFKKINDRFGHVEGDKVLKDLVEVIQGCLRPYDVLGRYGGEEFTILLPLTNLSQAHKIAERIRKEVEKHFSRGKKPVNCTISIGAAGCTPCEEDIDFEHLLRLSDKALYEAKRKGRNNVVLDT